MITIQTAMYVALGFLIASFLAVVLIPAYRARTVRLTSDRIRAQLPTTEAELRADKDRIRADSALRIHRLETKLAKLQFDASLQMVEVGRRDGHINTLTTDVDALKSEIDAAQNARGVLEHTISDRLPKIEQRLIEAKKLLFQRDREIANLNQDAERTQRALVEAVQINAQQRAEIERLGMVLQTRGAQNRDGLADPTFDTEVALRSELEALRSRSREQAAMIDRLQGDGGGEHIDVASAASNDDVPEVVRLQRDLVRAESALKAMKDVASAGQVEQSRHAADLRTRDQRIEDQARDIARLSAALAAYEAPAAASDRALSIKDSKIAMKSKLSALQAQADSQAESIRKLRAEVAASNERLARQAQHFMEEMRRLGAGTLPASTQQRRPPSAVLRRTLAQRISEAKPELAAAVNGMARPVLVKSDAKPQEKPAEAPAPERTSDAAPAPIAVAAAAGNGSAETAVTIAAEPAAVEPAAAKPAAATPRPRLVDRIADYGKG